MFDFIRQRASATVAGPVSRCGRLKRGPPNQIAGVDHFVRLGVDPASSPHWALSRQPGEARAPGCDLIGLEPRTRTRVYTYPQMPALVIAERLGWTGSILWLWERLRAIRPKNLLADPITCFDHTPLR